jgi:hypothetical protein
MNWASILEPATREQAERTASMKFIYPHLPLMPDCHLGKGATPRQPHAGLRFAHYQDGPANRTAAVVSMTAAVAPCTP